MLEQKLPELRFACHYEAIFAKTILGTWDRLVASLLAISGFLTKNSPTSGTTAEIFAREMERKFNQPLLKERENATSGSCFGSCERRKKDAVGCIVKSDERQ